MKKKKKEKTLSALIPSLGNFTKIHHSQGQLR